MGVWDTIGIALIVIFRSMPHQTVHASELAISNISEPNKPEAELHVCSSCSYTTIQEAVDAASQGDLIKVAEGSYTDIHQRSGITQVVYILITKKQISHNSKYKHR